MDNLQSFAINMLKNKLNTDNNPTLNKYIEVIQNGDAVTGSQIAENLCQTYGVSKEDAVKQAKAFFHLP